MSRKATPKKRPAGRKIRYAVVGLGHIAQVAVLPAFRHAANSELTALVSDDPMKLKKLGQHYKVANLYTYEEYEECLSSGLVDAVFIALPNHLHREFTVQALKAKRHVLCEKPMAVTEDECREMIDASAESGAKLMIGYRLHLEPGNLEAINLAQSGKIGTPKIFSSVFCMQVKEGNVRLKRDAGGGTIYDIGVYCINAARYLFRAEPVEVFAFTTQGKDPRFAEVDETTTAVLRFPGSRVASFTCSFGAHDISTFELVGTKGRIRMDPAYEYAEPLVLSGQLGQKKFSKTYPKHDQFAAEIQYFSDCILKNRQPEPSGIEGWADVRIVEALYRSAQMGQPLELEPFEKSNRPSKAQSITKPPVEEEALVHVDAPHK